MKNALEWRGDKITARVKIGVQGQMHVIGNELMNASVAQVPVQSGFLRESCHVDVGDMQVGVGYGAAYALRQHEDLGYAHKNGKAKFLEDPFHAGVQGYVERIREAVESGCGL